MRQHGSWFPLMVLTLCILSACSQSAGEHPSPSTLPATKTPLPPAASLTCPDALGPIAGEIAFSSEANLWAIQPDGTGLQQVTAVVTGTYAQTPAWSRDRATLAFSLMHPSTTLLGTQTGIICGLDRATGKGRLLAQSPNPYDALSEPSWTADDRALVVTHDHAVLDAHNQLQAIEPEVVRIDLATGRQDVLARRALDPVLSPDGTTLIYIALSPEGLAQLMIAAADGTNARPWLSPNPDFFAITSPRWSPDGTQVMFSANKGPTGGALPPALRVIEVLLGSGVASAHEGGIMSIWLAPPSGDHLTELQSGIDGGIVAWNPDGTSYAYTNELDGILVTTGLVQGGGSLIVERLDAGPLAWASQ